jgi:hypothetical protein
MVGWHVPERSEGRGRTGLWRAERRSILGVNSLQDETTYGVASAVTLAS